MLLFRWLFAAVDITLFSLLAAVIYAMRYALRLQVTLIDAILLMQARARWRDDICYAVSHSSATLRR